MKKVRLSENIHNSMKTDYKNILEMYKNVRNKNKRCLQWNNRGTQRAKI